MEEKVLNDELVPAVLAYERAKAEVEDAEKQLAEASARKAEARALIDRITANGATTANAGPVRRKPKRRPPKHERYRGRNAEAFALLKERGEITVDEMAQELFGDTERNTRKNVATILWGLKNDGYAVGGDGSGTWKFRQPGDGAATTQGGSP